MALYWEAKEHKKDKNKQGDTHTKQKIITGLMVLLGTYPLMVDFSSRLNHGKAPLWLCGIAMIISLGSAFFQAFLISRQEKNKEEDKRSTLSALEWFGKFFMSTEIILSFSNTAFSDKQSSFSDVIDVFSGKKQIPLTIQKDIGLTFFILSIAVFMHVTFSDFKVYTRIKGFFYSCCQKQNTIENNKNQDESILTASTNGTVTN